MKKVWEKLVKQFSIGDISFFILRLATILGGIAWAGFMGLFYGPVLMLLLVTTIEIYAERYAHEDRDYLGEALGKLDNNREAAAPEAGAPEVEAGQENATTTTQAEGKDKADSEGVAEAI